MTLSEAALPWLSLRSYVIAFEAFGAVATDVSQLAGQMATCLADAGVPAHLHGVFIPNHGLLYTRPVDPSDAEADDYFHVRFVTSHSLLTFKTLLLEGLATFPRPGTEWIPALDQYFSHIPTWHEQIPQQ